MKKILLIILCVMLLGGCNKNKEEKISEGEIALKYEEMENKLVEYGKLVYENEQWLNDEAVEITTAMTLKDLSDRNGYDISMFVDPKTNKQCDLDASMIEFIITNVNNLEDIKYEFNPVLVCGDYKSEVEYEDMPKEDYYNLYDILVEYIEKVYDKNTLDSKNLDIGTYKVTLNDFQEMGYDISMFVNSKTGKQCDLNDTYVALEVVEDNGKKVYEYNYYLNCE